MEKKRGGQKGNQNARKHGFYSKVLDENQQQEYEHAVTVEGLDEEIAMMRVKIKSLMENDPENVKLIMYALNALARLIQTKYDISKDDKKTITDSIIYVLKNIALPMGFCIGNILTK